MPASPFAPFVLIAPQCLAAVLEAGAAPPPGAAPIASGGTPTITAGVVSHTFTASGNFLVYVAGTVTAVNVTGGGSSGPAAGPLAIGSYPIVVGGGGSVVIEYPVADLLAGQYATGGTITVDGNYIRHTFNSSSTFALSIKGLLSLSDGLVVGAGGAGGSNMGGGGAGGEVLPLSATDIVTSVTVTIGVGGTGSAGNNGTSGGDSSFGLFLTANGGGFGGHGSTSAANGGNGGNGGGGGGNNVGAAGVGGTGDQFNGGTGSSGGGGPWAGGGGAGAEAIGTNAAAGVAGNGGNGVTWNGATYGGGGGGAPHGTTSGTAGTGGTGGGGAGTVGVNSTGGPGVAGTPNTGGGGGAAGNNLAAGGAGGSGIIIVRYLPGSFQPGNPMGFMATTGKFYYDFSDASTITDAGAGAISALADKYGVLGLTQGTAGVRPTTGVESLNGHNVGQFAADYLTAAAAAPWTFMHDGTDHCIVAVVKFGVVSNPAALYLLFGTNGAASANLGAAYMYDDTAALNDSVNQFVTRNVGGTWPVNNTGNNTCTANVWHIHSTETDPDNGTAASRSRIRIDRGSPIANNTSTAAINGAAPTYPFQLGAGGNNVFPFTGAIAAIACTSSHADRASIENFFAVKYAL